MAYRPMLSWPPPSDSDEHWLSLADALKAIVGPTEEGTRAIERTAAN